MTTLNAKRTIVLSLGIACTAALIGIGVFMIVTAVLSILTAQAAPLTLGVPVTGWFGPGIALSPLVVGGLGIVFVAGGATVLEETLRRDTKEARQSNEQLQHQQAKLNDQLRETAAQEERNRLARDLHDTIKQQLFSINVAAATAQSLRERDPNAAAQQIQQVRDLSQAASVEMKALLTQLRPQPLATIGLVGAIQEQLDALKFRSEVQTELRCDDLPDESQLPPGAQEAIFRVVQEALANVARHARAKRVVVTISPYPGSLRRRHIPVGDVPPLPSGEGVRPPSPFGRGVGGEGLLRITIQDDGQGFDPVNGKAGMGMSNMRARVNELGGAFDVQSAPHLGTTITVDVPLAYAEQARARAQRQKEERYQQVYWASSLTSFTGVLVLILGVALIQLFRQIFAGNQALLTPAVLLLAMGTAISLPLFFASINFRRRVYALAGDSDIWPKLLRSYDLMQLAYLGLLCALVLLSLKQFVWGSVAGVGAAAALAMALRAGREINTRTREWATYRMLRTRRNEQVIFIGIAVVFIILIFSGLYGDVRQVVFFHDEINGEWFASFMTLVYPLLMLCTAPGLVALQRQMNALRADGDDGAGAARAPGNVSLRPARVATSALAFAYGAVMVPLAGACLFSDRSDIATGIAFVAGVTLLAKSRIERRLTARIAEWSNLEVQNSAMTLYSIFLAAVLFGVVGAVIGYLAVAATPDAASGLPRTRMSPIAVGALASLFAGMPFYLFLMMAATWRRIKHLKSLTVH